MVTQRVGGIISVQRNGEVLNAKGNWTLHFGGDEREMVPGADRVHGWKGTPLVPGIEGQLTDRQGLDLVALFEGTDDSISIELGQGKVAVLENAVFTGKKDLTTEEGEVPCAWQGTRLTIVDIDS